MGIEIEVKQGTDAEVRIKFVNEKNDEFTTKNLNAGHQLSKDMLNKKNVVKINLADVFDFKDTSSKESKDLSLLLTSKELSFKYYSSIFIMNFHFSNNCRIESSDNSIIIRKISIKGSVIQSYSGDVQNKDGFKKLEMEQFYGCSGV